MLRRILATSIRMSLLICPLVLTVCSGSFGDEIQFSRDVLPILSDRCFHCHGPDGEHREADLRLDRRESVLDEDASIVVPKDLEASELFRRVASDDPSELMPPPDSNRKPLTAKEIEVLRKWILQGGNWQGHWSFEKPIRPEAPDLADQPIDAFIRARLKTMGLSPSPPADKRTLIRRVTLDLTGLPPTRDEIDAFLNDQSPQAYERLVDRLLNSPHYGERMAWPWLDAARYADTSGYQGDPERSMWPWRDWVVKALNQNMPFDQFTVEQLAGDLLPDATPEQRLATGFNRNHMHNSEGGRIAEETRVENVFDRAETTGTVWLGLTMQCARCHDHKYDPTTNQDYFAFFDFFNQTSEAGRTDRSTAVPPSMNYVPQEFRRRLEKTDQQLAELRTQLLQDDPKADDTQVRWESERWANVKPTWTPLEPIDFRSVNGATLSAQKDHILQVSGKRPEKDVYELKLRTSQKSFRSLRLEAIIDPQSPAKGTGRDEKGNFVLSEIEVAAKPADQPDAASVPVRFQKAYADLEQGNLVVANAIDGKVDSGNGWAVNGHTVKEPRWAVFVTDQPLKFDSGIELTVRLRFESEHTHHTLARFRLSTSDREVTRGGLSREEMLLSKPAAQRSPAEKAAVREYFRQKFLPRYSKIATRIHELEQQREGLRKNAKPIQVMVMDSLPKPRETFILVKGIYNDATDQMVTANVPNMLPSLTGVGDQRANRLDLARWIVSKENPLTARVTVNRFWQTFFGKGIVSTPEDFGLQGKQPSHPKLLDWLAVEFMESGWNVKHLHKLIVMSDTYRQSSRITKAMLEKDPANQFLARAPRYRMPSWMIRDQALAASGLLSKRSGGPPVKPYQPDGVWAEATFGKKKYSPDNGEKIYRRSLYTFWRRIIGPTMFFDSAKRQTCEVKPNRTNTPLHALTIMNDVTYVEAARVLAEKVMSAEADSEARIEMLFETLTARIPNESERKLLTRRIETYIDHFESRQQEAIELLSVGQAPRDTSLDPAEHAGYTTMVNMLMNLDEVLVKP